MNGTIFSQSALQRRAAWLALFAILLIVVAPLISHLATERSHERDAGHASCYADGRVS